VRAIAIGAAVQTAGQTLANTPARCPANPNCRLTPDEQAAFASIGQALIDVAPRVTMIASSNKSREAQREEITVLLRNTLASQVVLLAIQRLSPDAQSQLGSTLQLIDAAM
jgi:hypothetical protein